MIATLRLTMLMLCAASVHAAPFPFREATPLPIRAVASTNEWIAPSRYRALTLDEPAMRQWLAMAPMEQAGAGVRTGTDITLPMPDGRDERFRIVESSILAPKLQAAFPEIRTYMGQGVDDPTATVRLDQTPAGFHAIILSARGSVYIDPLTRDRSLYASYAAADATTKASWSCGVKPAAIPQRYTGRDVIPQVAVGTQLRTYRMACAATAEYTTYHGGTITGGLAAVVTAINRVTAIYEREFAIRLVLVANNQNLIFTNTATDGYTNNDGNALLTENQTKCNAVIGSANYDIGHVFSTDGGGLAALGSVCTSSKAQGQTGSAAPVGDPFYVDYVCHEVGHQFGAEHTFNSEADSCGGGNRSATTAYEVGSGSTIMGYAGICGTDDVQPLSGDYFHSISLDQISAYVATGDGSSCPVTTATGNQTPVVDAGPSWTIPKATPFILTASGSDPDGDSLTYNWEERDLGPATVLGATDNGSSPLFRSFNPTTNNWRIFPSLSNILANTTNKTEMPATTARTMSFRVSVRDNRSGGGGVNGDDTTVTVVTNAGPFMVTNFNASGTHSGLVTVGWSVAGTTNAPVNVSHVRILLSTNGGLNFPFVLHPYARNNGSALVALPLVTSSLGRIKVEAVSNIFFDISNTNIALRAASAALVVAPGDTFVREDRVPMNGLVDPGELVTFNFALSNAGTTPATNVAITLFASNGITPVVSTAVYGVLSAGVVSNQPLSFRASGPCMGTVTALLRVTYAPTNAFTFSRTFLLGQRVSATESRTNPASITLNDGTAATYPSTLNVSGVSGGVSRIRAILRGLSHTYPDDLDILLTGPGGQKVMLMSDCGGAGDISAVHLTFSDDAPAPLSASTIASGTYRPSDLGSSDSAMPGPAPAAPYATTLAVFTNSSVNGTWSLYIRDEAAGDVGQLASGWSLEFVTERDACTLDTDSDGIDDEWEVRYFGGATNASQGALAANGLTIRENYIAQLDPTNPTSFFKAGTTNPIPGELFQLVIPTTTPDRVYGVRGTTNLLEIPQDWALLAPEQSGSGSSITFTLTNQVPGRTYRANVRLP